MTRFGLCCIFRDQPIKFSTTTATAMARLPRAEALARLSRICLANAEALRAAPRVLRREWDRLLPDPEPDPPPQDPSAAGIHDGRAARSRGDRAAVPAPRGAFARAANLRTCFHPDQFVVLNSPRPEHHDFIDPADFPRAGSPTT